MKTLCTVSVLFLMGGFRVFGQTNVANETLEDQIERLFEMQDEEVNYEDMYESLLTFYSHPLDLNKATFGELQTLYLLSPTQISNLLRHRDCHGLLLSIYELQAVPGFDEQVIRGLLPFVTVANSRVDSRSFLARMIDNESNYLIIRNARKIQQSRGFREHKFAGDQNQVYTRLRVHRRNDFSIGLTAEKDAGEPLAFSDSIKGFDYYSFHIQLMDLGPVRNVILGDYQAQFGQGLVLGSGFSPGKGAETITTVKRSNVGVRPYTSVLESGFFRGGAVSLGGDRLNGTIMYSSVLQDGNPISDTTYSEFDEFVNSIQTTGLHRTARERAARDQVRESTIGANTTWSPLRTLHLGSNVLYSSFDRPLQKRPANYNQFEFTGDKNLIGSVFAEYVYQNMSFFGETAISRSRGRGSIIGLITTLTNALDFSLVYRNYSRDFHSFYARGFGENSRTINERGVYWGLNWRPNRQHQIALYYDQFDFPWLKFRVDAPSEGLEYLTRYTYRPSREITLFIQYRQEHKQRTVRQEASPLTSLSNGIKNVAILNADYQVTPQLTMKTRLQWSQYKLSGNKSEGLAMVQDINLDFGKLRVSGRFALFGTDDFENRQYIYERDVLYAFSIPAYHGTGTRQYLLLRYKVNRSISLWLRYGRFRYHDREKIGSGQDEIQGKNLEELKMQLMWKF